MPLATLCYLSEEGYFFMALLQCMPFTKISPVKHQLEETEIWKLPIGGVLDIYV